MLTVAQIIAKLSESHWPDGESLQAIEQWLTREQLDGPGSFILRFSSRGSRWLLRGRVMQGQEILFEVLRQLPGDVTESDIEATINEWQRLGYATVVPPVRSHTEEQGGDG